MLERVLFDNVALRLLEERDADELHALVERDRAHLAQWLPFASAQTRDSGLEFIRSTRAQLAENNGVQTAITVDGAIVGVIGMHAVSWLNLSTSIGYWLGESFEGRGIMTAAVSAYLDYSFHELGLHRLELRAAVQNTRSRAVAERLGFTNEGVARSSERVGETTLDVVVYSMLSQEWVERSSFRS